MARVAIVTGGTRGIGEAISVALKNAGYKVAANYMGNDERARAFTEKTGIPAYKWDVADFEACQAGVAKVAADLGPVDIVVNNAGITRDGTMRKMSRERLGRGARYQSRRLLQHVQGGVGRHAGARLRPHRQHRLDQRPGRPIRPGELRRRQIGHSRLHQGAGAGGRAQGHHRQRDRAWLYRYRHGGRGARPTCWKRSWRAFRSAGSARPPRSRAACCSWSPTMPASSPARRCRSMAASICIEAARGGRQCGTILSLEADDVACVRGRAHAVPRFAVPRRVRARRCRWKGRTARAKPRCCACSPACCRRPPGPSACN